MHGVRHTIGVAAWLLCVLLPLAAAARDRPQCSIELLAAESIVTYRERGHPKEFLTDMLPPRPGTPGGQPRHKHPSLTGRMYFLIDEIYAHPTIKLRAYLEYRNLECLYRTDHRAVPSSLSDVSLLVERCQTRYDQPHTPGLAACVARVFEDYGARRAPATIAD